MKKILNLSLVALLDLVLISCSSGIKSTTSPVAYSDLDKEYSQFNTKALTVSYLKKKLDKWKKDNNGKKMLRELEYAKFKHINVLEQVINSEPDSYAYYEGLKDFIEITSKEGNDAAFKSFIVSLSPDPSSVTSLDASNITTTSFTANWSVVTNATGYMLIVDNGTPIDVGNVTSKNITGLSAGSSHSYVVKSVNEGGTSEASSPVNVTLKTDAPVASDVTNLAQTSFTANWGSVTGATSYKLFVDGISVYTGSSTSCNVTSLAVGSSHSYYVQAINSGGTSSNSNTINLTLNPAIAGVPVATDATSVTQTAFTANWASVSGATSYKLKVDNGAFTDVGNITSKNITGLTPGSSHTYTVQAVNISGASADSNTISFTLITGNPNANPATDITNTSFTANWNSLTGATSYKLFIDDVEAYSGTDLSFNKTGLTPNSSHSYYVKAVNASGTSPIGNNISLTLKTDAPVATSATSINDTSFTANWATVTGATGYNLFVDGTSVYTGTSTSANITALTANSSHSYYVQATNAGGNSANSNTVNLTLNPATPVTPTASAATNITTTGFTANWASVSGATTYKLKVDSSSFTDVGNVTHYDVTGLTAGTTHTYTVQASNINGTSSNSTPDISVTLKTIAPVASDVTSITDTSFTANWGTVTGATGYNLFVDGTSVYTGTSTSANITGLTANSSHSYYVQATNAGGASANSNTINLTLNPATPVTPTASAATNVTNTGFTANWATVTGATSYKLKVDSGSFTDVGNVTSYAVTGLTPATTHTYTVQASNINGTSSNSIPDISVTLKTDAPVATSATDITTNSFTANWGSVTGANGYKLYVDSVNVYTGTSTSVNITGLSSGVTHTYYVQATNAGGNSANSNTINALTIPVAPVASAATNITTGSFTANWATVTGATSYNLVVYTIIGGRQSNKVNVILPSNTTSYDVTLGIGCFYKVTAINDSGTSAVSNIISFILMPSTPVATDATDITSTSFTANWSLVNASSYKLYVNGVETVLLGSVSSYSVTGLLPSTSYSYYVKAVNSLGESSVSNTINTTSANFQLTEINSIPTSGARDWEHFTIGTNDYLAVSNNSNGAGADINSYIYKWNTSTNKLDTTPIQTILTNGIFHWKHFKIGTNDYIISANYYNGSYNLNSKIYKWNTGTSQFDEYQSIPTNAGTDNKIFTIGTNTYLAISSLNTNTSYIYKWNTSTNQFDTTPIQSIALGGVFNCETFTIGTNNYLSLSAFRYGVYNLNSKIYKWNTGTSQFDEIQSIPTNGAVHSKFFTIGTDNYLVIANHHYNTSYNTDSKIYKWNTGTNQFDEIQSIPTHGAMNWNNFTIGTNTYLTLANYSDDSSININSKIYKWNSGTNQFDEYLSVGTNGAMSWTPFTIGGKNYLALANLSNGSSNNIDSKIYRID